MPEILRRLHDAALDALRSCCTQHGLKASGDRVGHHQIWARDSMIALLGARFAADDQIQRALRASVATLRREQAASGAIPNNVDTRSGRPNFRAYADAGLWWIIGSTCIAPDVDGIRSVLRWYECQDVDQSGLISMQESADWQDLFCTRGKGLYLNCLYAIALDAAASVADIDADERSAYTRRAQAVRQKINEFFWYRGDGNMLPHVSHTFSTESKQQRDSLGRKRWLPEKRYLAGEQYYLPYLGFRAVGEWFDCLGNILAVLSGVADSDQTRTVVEFIVRHSLDEHPLTSLYPAVQPGDPDWRDYYGMLNLPHCYHNGGIWPFIGGFYIAALIKCGRSAAAEAALLRLASLNEAGGFNEWHHGATAEPMGVRRQAWSAGMFLFALECVNRGTVPAFCFDTGQACKKSGPGTAAGA